MRLPFFALAFASLVTIKAVGADWKYAGSSPKAGGKADHVFIDAESITRTGRGSFRFWTKTYPSSEVDRLSKKRSEEMIKKSAEKIATQYMPPYTIIHPDHVPEFDDG